MDRQEEYSLTGARRSYIHAMGEGSNNESSKYFSVNASYIKITISRNKLRGAFLEGRKGEA